MAEIAVELDVLAGVASWLDRAGEQLDGMSGSLARPTAAQTGHAGLARALDEFADRWEHGLRAAATAVDTAGDQLAEAMRVYSTLEEQIAEAAG